VEVANLKLNLDHDLARALHRVVRAMHDGECPRCHKVHMSDVMHVIDRGPGMDVAWSGLRCPNCKFQISDEEAAEVFRIFGPFMEQNLDLFVEWRHSRNKEPSIGRSESEEGSGAADPGPHGRGHPDAE
jgi:ssDNA-binding Zn-finger/Zn-ribbon topoisomerase 1